MERQAAAGSQISQVLRTTLSRRGLPLLDLMAGARSDGTSRRGRRWLIAGLIVAAALVLVVAAVLFVRDENEIEYIAAHGVSTEGTVIENQISRSGDGPDTLIGICISYAYEASEYRRCPNADHTLPVGSTVTVRVLPDEPDNPVIVGDLAHWTGDVTPGLVAIVGFGLLVWLCLAITWGAFRRSRLTPADPDDTG